MTDRDSQFSTALDDVVARIAAIVALGGVAMVHALQLPDAFAEVDYLGVLFVLTAVACIALAAVMTRTNDDRVWMAAGGLPALVVIGYLFSRTSGLPGFTGDIGEWTEPLALAALIFEGLLICLSAAALAPHYARPSATVETGIGRPLRGAQ